MGKMKDVMVLTTENFHGWKITEVKGLVYGSSVRSRTIGGNIIGQMRAMWGGKQTGYMKLINQARDEAVEDMKTKADDLGANAVLCLRFDSGQFDSDENNKGAMQETTAYGTAVVAERIVQIASSGTSANSGGTSSTGAVSED